MRCMHHVNYGHEYDVRKMETAKKYGWLVIWLVSNGKLCDFSLWWSVVG